MAVLFVTVGTSVLTNERIGAIGGRNNDSLAAAVAAYQSDAAKAKVGRRPYGGLFDDLNAAHILAWKQREDFFLGKDERGNPRNFRTTSAELLSTFLLARLVRVHVPRMDKVVLFASDTAEGRFAADLNREVLQSGEYREKIGWGDFPVEVEPIEGLDDRITSPKDQVLSLIEKHRDGPQVRINLTGGYKGFAALLGYMAAERQYNLFYIHEALLRPAFVIKGIVTETPGGDW